MIKIITYGTFDLLHYGHINLLKRARALGDHLTVVLSTDKFNKECKDKICIQSYEERKLILESLRFVDNVIPENCWEQKISDIKDNNIDIFVMRSDWEGAFNFLNEYCKVIYIPRTEGISSTMRKQKIKEM